MRSMSHISLLLNIDSVLCNMFHKKNESWKAEKFKFEKVYTTYLVLFGYRHCWFVFFIYCTFNFLKHFFKKLHLIKFLIFCLAF